MPSFEDTTHRNGESGAEPGRTRAMARFPGLDIEIVHRHARWGDAEQISIYLRATPSFEAFSRALEASNPFTLWAQGAQLARQSWLDAGRILIPPLAPFLPTPKSEAASHDVTAKQAK